MMTTIKPITGDIQQFVDFVLIIFINQLLLVDNK